MDHTTNLGLTIYGEQDKFRIAQETNSYNANMQILDEKVTPKPASGDAYGKILQSNGDGTTQWVKIPTVAQLEEALDQFFEDNPDFQALVADGSITLEKMNSGAIATVSETLAYLHGE